MALLNKITGAPDANGVRCKIPPSHFVATLYEVDAGEITATQAGNFWGGYMEGDWEASDSTDFNWLLNQIPTVDKPAWFIGLTSILYAVELDAPGYVTDSEIKQRIERL